MITKLAFKRRTRSMRRPEARGMTLIEVLIVVALSAVIMIALLSLYMAGQKYFFNQNSRADTIEESRMPMAWISRDIRDANQVHEGAVVVNGHTYATGANCLVLDVPSIDGTGLIIAGSVDYVVYTYDSINHQLIRIVSPNGGVRPDAHRVMADSLISDGAGGLPFKLKYFRSDGTTEITSGYEDATNGAFIVEVELTSQGRSIQRGSQPFTETVRTQAKLRNKNIPG
jgi:prepilin-type N-terminal cleavage/methylation domain-containing protein